MEVHHHAHSSRKKWTNYFWEFSMLFLAVFCGFLAEYQLEHVIEHNKEKEFVKSYIEDLKSDTAAIRPVLAFRKRKLEKMDSLMLLLRTQQIKGHESDLYYFGRILIRSSGFQSNDRTITQLKNSGSLRLIRNEQAADSMMSYQKFVESIISGQEDDHTERFSTYPIISHIFSPFEFDKMVTTTSIIRPDNNPPLLSYDRNLQLDLAFYVHQLRGSSLILIPRLEKLNTKAINIMAFLKKEYHLE